MDTPLTRRTFLATTGAALIAPGALAQDEAWNKACHDARWRKRRIIMNNDGNDVYHVTAEDPQTVAEFLARRTTALADSQVDSIFYCTGVFNLYTHETGEAEMLFREGPPGDFFRALLAQGTDPLRILIDFCRKHDREIFWSMRMNDTHDSGDGKIMCQWKRDHPEYLVGEKGKKLPYGCNRWSSVDYGLEPVREKVYRILEDVATRYDVDGLELDFFRHPVLFRPQMTGDPVTQEHCDLMTGLMRRIRSMADETGRARKKPLLIAIRVPDSVGYCRAMGIDLERWLSDGLVDVLVGGGYFHMTPWTDWAALGHAHDVPTYAALVSRRLLGEGEPDAQTVLEVWRGEALNAWDAGVDGIYTFNRFDPKDAIFRELGDPALLRTLPYTRQESFVAKIWSRPETWLKDGGQYVHKPAAG